MKKLTVEVLIKAGACDEGIERFRRVFPNGTFCTNRDVKKWLADTKGSWAAAAPCWSIEHLLGLRSVEAPSLLRGLEDWVRFFASEWRRKE